MASRSSGGSGLVVTIAILGVASLTLFILTIVFLSKYQAATRNLTQVTSETEDFVRADERQRDDVSRIKDKAKKDRKSVVGYLAENTRNSMLKVTGNQSDLLPELSAAMEKESVSGNSLLGALRERKNEIDALNQKVAQIDTDRKTAQADRDNEIDRNKKLQESHTRTVQTLNGSIDGYKAEVEAYREAVNQAKAMMDAEVQKIRDQLASVTSALNEKIRKGEDENLTLKDQIAKLRASQSTNILHPKSEETLVDGDIIAINQASNTLTISRGQDAKVILGMSFSVYSDATAVKPDPRTGNYPAPKAKIEVINVGATSSTCRVTEEVKGNPVVRGDVIANALYDPNKVYTFMVYGNFDTNGDGMATQQEAEDIKAMIAGWGGKVADDLTGNVDFLILGDRPLLPPPPGVNDPIDVVKAYMRLNDIATRYDKLFETAAATSLPVLNQNRLFTLIGRRPGGR